MREYRTRQIYTWWSLHWYLVLKRDKRRYVRRVYGGWKCDWCQTNTKCFIRFRNQMCSRNVFMWGLWTRCKCCNDDDFILVAWSSMDLSMLKMYFCFSSFSFQFTLLLLLPKCVNHENGIFRMSQQFQIQGRLKWFGENRPIHVFTFFVCKTNSEEWENMFRFNGIFASLSQNANAICSKFAISFAFAFIPEM